MSLRDVSRAVKGDAGTKKVTRTVKIDVDIDIITRAIQLVRAGKARNPNDLVLEFRISLEQARYLFNTIAENEKSMLLPMLEASRKVEELWEDVVKHIY